ncbi:MAG: ParB/RepB/Spo0J family partition protein [Oscillospiraceae bacterium]|nr:ParB/RepB/Spo0J family partition protein [Oscillospiraceae bacterium]
MKSSAKNISLTPLDDLFSTEEERSKDVVGTIVNIPLPQLHDFPNHPFKVRDDEKMQETVESVKAYGVLVPAIVRQRTDGEYEIVSGHRRKRASELAGLRELPAIIRDLDDDAATIIMVDSNLQRENILPSERAQAYKMKLEAIKRQGARTDLTSRQVGGKLNTTASVGEAAGDSERQVQRYIRLTELQPELQELVDTGKMAMTPAVELSYLKPKEQEMLLETIDSEQATPSLSQAQRMKKLSQTGELNEDTMLSIMAEQKKPELSSNITLSGERLRKYFPKSYTPAQIENTIFKLLDSWLRKRQREECR